MVPELEPELDPLPELEPEASSPPELEPLLDEALVSPPSSVVLTPLLLPEPEFEELEHALVPNVPMPPIANRQIQKASFFMFVTQSPRLGGPHH